MHTSLVEGLTEGALLNDACSCFWSGPGCAAAVRASHSCALLSVISWHGVSWQRNKPPRPMITPTANKHLCMGEAWLGPQIVLIPSVVCLHKGTGVCVWGGGVKN